MDLRVGTTPIAIMSNFILGKVESKNPSGSIRDRVVEYTLNSMKNDSKIRIGAELITVATNEFAVSFAYFCAKKGYKPHIITNESINESHRNICKIYGAELYEFENLSYDKLLKKKDEFKVLNPNLIYVDLYDKEASIKAYSVSISQELKHQIQSSGKNLKRIFLFDEPDFLADTLKKHFPVSSIYNVRIKNSFFTFNKAKRDVVNNFNLFPELKLKSNNFDKELSINLDKVVENIQKVASSSGLIMDYRTSALYLAAKEYICFNNDVNLIFFYENGERYLEEIYGFKK
jgi:cysteine synthase A